MKRFAASMVLVIGMTAMPVRAEPPKLAVGEPFPVMVLPSIHGGSEQVPRLGRKTVLQVFASW